MPERRESVIRCRRWRNTGMLVNYGQGGDKEMAPAKKAAKKKAPAKKRPAAKKKAPAKKKAAKKAARK